MPKGYQKQCMKSSMIMRIIKSIFQKEKQQFLATCMENPGLWKKHKSVDRCCWCYLYDNRSQWLSQPRSSANGVCLWPWTHMMSPTRWGGGAQDREPAQLPRFTDLFDRSNLGCILMYSDDGYGINLIFKEYWWILKLRNVVDISVVGSSIGYHWGDATKPLADSEALLADPTLRVLLSKTWSEHVGTCWNQHVESMWVTELAKD